MLEVRMEVPQIHWAELKLNTQADVEKWCKENCKGLYRRLPKTNLFQFANKSDAALFKLYWG